MNAFSSSKVLTKNQSLILVIFSYCIWGFLVLYLSLLKEVSALEIMVHRALWAATLLWIYALIKGNFKQILSLFQSKKLIKSLGVSTIFLTCNWTLFVYAITIDNALATSMAYFICPTFTMALALTFFSERLNRLQWLSMIFIFSAIAYKIFGSGQFPWLSVAMALTWSIYSMMQKKLAIASVNKLTVETTLSLPLIAIFYLSYAHFSDYEMVFSFKVNGVNFLLMGCGIMTIAPLLLYNTGVQKTELKWVGILQYIVPSISFLTAVYILGETLDWPSLISFILIWIGMVCFILAQLRENRKSKKISQKML